MFSSIWQDVKDQFSAGNMVTRLIILNLAVFVIINLVNILLSGMNLFQGSPYFSNVVHFFSISSDWWYNLTHPWVLITNMFLHTGFWHILWNMLFLFWFGRIVGDLIGDHHILPLYLLGGFVGAMVFFITVNILPYGANGIHYAMGASGAVMAIIMASGVIAPDYNIHLIFIGPVKLKYIVFALIFLDLISLANNVNTGGHFAHLGGVLFGWFYIKQLRSGQDLSLPVNNFITSVGDFFRGITSNSGKGTPARKPRVVYKNVGKKSRRRGGGPHSITDTEDLSHQEKIDAILDKIKQSGYDSLTEEEKEFLYNAGKD